MAVNKVVYGNKTLIDLSNDSITADALVQGFTAHDKKGVSISGANPYAKAATDATVQTQAELIAQIAAALEGKAAGGSGGDRLETGILTGTTTYGAVGGTYYYYDLTDFNDKLLIILTYVGGMFVILARHNTADAFDVLHWYDTVITPRLVEDNILEAAVPEYDYFAV